MQTIELSSADTTPADVTWVVVMPVCWSVSDPFTVPSLATADSAGAVVSNVTNDRTTLVGSPPI